MQTTVDLLLCFPEQIYSLFVVDTLIPLLGETRIARVLCKEGMRSEYAREILLNEFLRGDSDYVFILDADMILPRHALLRMLAHGKKVVSGFYFSRGDRTWPIVFRPDEPTTLWPKTRWFDYPQGGLHEVGATGHGCLLIHRSIFERLEPPYSRLGPFMDQPLVGSDVRLCMKIREEAQEKIWCDFSLKCGHLTARPIEERDWVAIKENSMLEWQKHIEQTRGNE